MERDPHPYRILVVEDNPGDFTLIEDFLHEQILTPIIDSAETFQVAVDRLAQQPSPDVVLLDMSLPDKSGEALLVAMLEKTIGIPMIVLTGYADLSFGVKSLAMGVSDYLLKDDLSPLSLYKSMIYSIERKRKMAAIEESERRYSELFHISPQPMWVYDIATLRFLNVNEAAIRHYGYSRAEFLAMNLRDIRPPSEIPSLQAALLSHQAEGVLKDYGLFYHQKKPAR